MIDSDSVSGDFGKIEESIDIIAKVSKWLNEEQRTCMLVMTSSIPIL